MGRWLSLCLCVLAGATLEAQGPSIAVVVDTHSSHAKVIEFQRQVIDALKAELTGTNGNAVVISYSDRTRLLSDWSPVSTALAGAAARLAPGAGVGQGRDGVLNDGLMDALGRLDSSSKGQPTALIVIGEGNDGGSTALFSQVLRTAKDRHVRCFALLVATHRSQVGRVRQFGFDLYRLTSGTGGKLYDIRTNRTRMDEALKDLKRRLSAS